MADESGRSADEIAWLQGAHPSSPPGRHLPDGLETGSLESFSAVIDALAAERGAPRAEIISRMIQELEDRIAVDRAVISQLRRL